MAKNIKYKITDLAALRAEYPTLVNEVQVTKTVVDQKKLYALIKANAGIGRTVVGVEVIEDADTDTSEVDADAVDDAVNGNDDDTFETEEEEENF